MRTRNAPDIARVYRETVDPARGSITLRGSCRCGWKSDRLITYDLGSDRANAPATNKIARMIVKHVRDEHDG